MATLIENILPAIDAARGVRTSIGAALYRVFVRTSSWAGGSPFNGLRTDVDYELLPRPKVMQQGRKEGVFDVQVLGGGMITVARLQLRGISGLIPLEKLSPILAGNQRAYYVLAAADGAEILETLYVLDKGPFRNLTEWVVELLKAEA